MQERRRAGIRQAMGCSLCMCKTLKRFPHPTSTKENMSVERGTIRGKGGWLERVLLSSAVATGLTSPSPPSESPIRTEGKLGWSPWLWGDMCDLSLGQVTGLEQPWAACQVLSHHGDHTDLHKGTHYSDSPVRWAHTAKGVSH